jgi:hypothetical protein
VKEAVAQNWSSQALERQVSRLSPLALLASLLACPALLFAAEPKPGEMAGYLLVPNDKVPTNFNAGFSMDVAAWPLLKEYPGSRFQTGLFGTWMFAQHESKGPTNAYSDIEGGVAPAFVEWVPVRAGDVPPETGLTAFQFKRPREKRPEPYVTPEDPASAWNKPGPVTGPFQTQLGDGSVVTYCWYRFADQPAPLNADMTDAEREAMQARVEKIYRSWQRDRDYLPPPALGDLVELDPALIITPPKGLEAGYVPIVTRQGAKD